MADIVQYVHATKTPAFLLALSVFAVLMIYKEVIDRHVKKHIPIPVPIDLIVVRKMIKVFRKLNEINSNCIYSLAC